MRRRSIRVAVLGSALVATVSLVAAALPETTPDAAALTTHQVYKVPAGKVFTLHGRGFGHGHGMSQYGAYGAATDGLTYRQIMAFYYPGTSWGTVSGNVRVLISEDTSSDVQVSAASGLRVRDLTTNVLYRLPANGATRWRLTVSGSNRTVLGYYTDAWHRYHPGELASFAGDAQFRADVPLTLWTPSGSSAYRGALRSASPTPGSAQRDTVNVLSLDRYVRGVIPAEMPASWSPEALRAQAVAARTYATWSRDQNADGTWQICDTSACQVYRGVDAEDPRSNAAVRATAGQILTYGGQAAFTQFSSSSGGWTSAGGEPYLVAKKDSYDNDVTNPVHRWTLRLSAKRIRAAYPAIGKLKRLVVTRRDGNGAWGGRVERIVLDGKKANRTISGDTFRSVFGLRSSWFRG